MLKSMLQHLRDVQVEELEEDGAGEAGFTLIELMVVLLIIAILLAIAIPTFLGVTGSANDRAGQSNLTNAITEASAVYQNNNQQFPNAAASYQSAAPEFTWEYGAVCTKAISNCISIDASTDQNILVLADISNNNKCWYAILSPFENANTSPVNGVTEAPATPGTFYDYQTPVPAAGCNAQDPTNAWAHWSSTYGAAAATAGK